MFNDTLNYKQAFIITLIVLIIAVGLTIGLTYYFTKKHYTRNFAASTVLEPTTATTSLMPQQSLVPQQLVPAAPPMVQKNESFMTLPNGKQAKVVTEPDGSATVYHPSEIISGPIPGAAQAAVHAQATPSQTQAQFKAPMNKN